MRKSPEYIALEKIKNMNSQMSMEKYIAKVDSIACDATMEYEFVQDDLLAALEELYKLYSFKPNSDVFSIAAAAIEKAKGVAISFQPLRVIPPEPSAPPSKYKTESTGTQPLSALNNAVKVLGPSTSQ